MGTDWHGQAICQRSKNSKLQKTIPDVKFHIKYQLLAGVLCIQLTNCNVMLTLPTQTYKSGSDKHNIWRQWSSNLPPRHVTEVLELISWIPGHEGLMCPRKDLDWSSDRISIPYGASSWFFIRDSIFSASIQKMIWRTFHCLVHIGVSLIPYRQHTHQPTTPWLLLTGFKYSIQCLLSVHLEIHIDVSHFNCCDEEDQKHHPYCWD